MNQIVNEQRQLGHFNGLRSKLRNPNGRHYHAIQIVLIIGLALSITCLCIRLYIKRLLCKKFTPEDIFLAIAWTLLMATQTMILYALDYAGLGLHIWDLTPKTIEYFEKLLTAATCLFVSGHCLARLAHLIFFHRLVAAKKWLRYVLLAVAALIIIGSLVIICTFVFACRPIGKAWDISASGSCMDRSAIFVALAALNICSDICLFILPIPVVFDLRISGAQKAKFMAFLFLICSTFVASAIRLRVTVPLLGRYDITYRMTSVALLVGVESNLIIIAACLPAIRQCYLLTVACAKSPRSGEIIILSRQQDSDIFPHDRSCQRISNVLGDEFSPSPASSWAREVLSIA